MKYFRDDRLNACFFTALGHVDFEFTAYMEVSLENAFLNT